MKPGDKVAYTSAIGETVCGIWIGKEDKDYGLVHVAGQTVRVAISACWKVPANRWRNAERPEELTIARPSEEQPNIMQEFKSVMKGFLLIAVIFVTVIVIWKVFLIPEPTHVAP